MAKLNICNWAKRYRYVLLVLLLGLMLMLLPVSSTEEAQPVIETAQAKDMEQRLEEILRKIDGAGEVAVMLTEETGEKVIYQTDGDSADTVLVTDAQRNEQGLVRTREPPAYRGAIIVCTGADSAGVRLAVTDAVAKVTGLGTDKISVLKME